jgi:DNA polymerase-4
LAGRRVTLKVTYGDFVRTTRSATLQEATDDGVELFKTGCQLLEKTEAGQRPVRLLGISVSRLSPHGHQAQLSLFQVKADCGKSKRLHHALDTIHEKFGEEALVPGTLLKE